ncbi:DUF378 domain-containing protein [Alkalibacterium olivapovliticus]|uniref:DUF378 domain-containing protein n=1 Tax=Alkalibacterium olivapovliticus TaxID=99907 RepID=A0A2T0W5C4_9LACT|nr:DUF378 domain-containing protein [Alkalibacterium olivapovliticus]MCC5895361.1 DUF378 domain-containing protein [Alkalibacterium sp.]PRY80970.1 hypothetical protein CLV38_12031 [Alkalibacterium olivapovliticus]
MKIIDRAALTILIIGGIHLLLIGLIGFNVVETAFGDPEQWGVRIVYILIGLSALWCFKYYSFTPRGGSRLKDR